MKAALSGSLKKKTNEKKVELPYGDDRDNPRCQDNVREKYELGRSSKALKTNARKNRIEDGILSNKDLDNRKHQIDVNIVPGKQKQMKDGILGKRRGNKDGNLDNRNHRN
ncbi:hypothetical protein H5410_023245 [Solanum commersonii]|uniref:Uncharacterized protein n=1 Tax=Solanum commersonii TaxID=4109 RepID=A0A9J5ZJB7_SOLCO|nr:hypothetical protein H5410_023245 [Solanum commersonii]